jgi:two-component system, OmpR family, phosphate regulon sensor histidine kinase PhoR
MKIRLAIRRTFERMKKNVFLLIVLINSAALLGLFFTQIFWIREAHHLINDQFTTSVRVALKGAVNQLLENELKEEKNILLLQSDSLHYSLPEASFISRSVLESKIAEEFSALDVGDDYKFGIIDLKNHTILAGKSEGYEKELFNSPNRVTLAGFRDADNYFVAAYIPGQNANILKELFHWIIVSILFGIVLMIGFPVSLFIFNRQKRLSGMKTDFINNMTHEFKTPIATISLASEMLLKKQVQDDPEKAEKYARIIFDENTRLQNHVEQILSVSMLERGQVRLKKRETDIHLLISEIVSNFSITVAERDGKIRTHFCATNYKMDVDPSHLTSVIINLLDNANKYSADKPWIRIGTQNSDNGLVITVEDKGIGIGLENQRLIFRNLYRVPTGNIHHVKGFGIGLYYVKTIVEAHGGHINLKSEINKGSRFDVYLPFINKPTEDEHYSQT